MKIGLQIPRFHWPGSPEHLGEQLGRIASTADANGFASIWVMDHLFQIQGVGDADNPMLEAYTTLGYLAMATKKARLGAMVTAVTYRHPGFLVKAVTTLDVLSGGRAYLGIGAAWFEREARGLDLPFPPLKERFERLEETLQIAHKMWSGDRTPYEGKHYHLAEPLTNPQPLSKPHPPILIGGSGETKTLRFVAQYADGCNFFARMGEDFLKGKLETLKRHCDEVGRDYNDIERTVLANIDPSDSGGLKTAEFIDDCRLWAKLGIQHVIISNV